MRTLVLNLDTRPDRWKQVQIDLAAVGITGYERFSAVPGGRDGCRKSHCAMWRMLIADPLHDCYRIFEDDVCFVRPPAESFPSDFDMFLFGGNHYGIVLPCEDGHGRLSETYATHAYIISKRCASDHVDEMEEHDGAVDVYMAKRIHKQGNSFCQWPNAAVQRNGHSDVENREVDYDKYLRGCFWTSRWK